MHLILGLGNPGARYQRTRHNAGFLVVDRLAARSGVTVERKQLGAVVEQVRLGNESVVLAKPQSYMNLSGQAGASLRGYYKVEDGNVVVVHDDMDLPFGDIRLKQGGGHGGHNGLRDLVEKLGTAGFVRVRVGVGRPPEGWAAADWVLATWAATEETKLPEVLERASDAVHAVVQDGLSSAMNRTNRSDRATP